MPFKKNDRVLILGSDRKARFDEVESVSGKNVKTKKHSKTFSEDDEEIFEIPAWIEESLNRSPFLKDKSKLQSITLDEPGERTLRQHKKEKNKKP